MKTGTRNSLIRMSLTTALALALAGGLAACGKRGNPEPPPGVKSDFPRVYPNPDTYKDPARNPKQAVPPKAEPGSTTD